MGSTATTRRRIVVGIVALMLWSGCDDDDGTTPVAQQELPPLELTDDTPELLFTWFDERGRTHTAVAIADIPAEGRRHPVRVITKGAGNGSLFYVADLDAKEQDGGYPVRSMPRSAWEKLLADRRLAHQLDHAPQQPSDPRPGSPQPDNGEPDEPRAQLSAIVYGASWCQPCHAATAFLRSRGVNVVEHDVEKQPQYAREMQQKLRGAGHSGGSIPVIDLGGIILRGYSRPALESAIARLRRATAL